MSTLYFDNSTFGVIMSWSGRVTEDGPCRAWPNGRKGKTINNSRDAQAQPIAVRLCISHNTNMTVTWRTLTYNATRDKLTIMFTHCCSPSCEPIGPSVSCSELYDTLMLCEQLANYSRNNFESNTYRNNCTLRNYIAMISPLMLLKRV